MPRLNPNLENYNENVTLICHQLIQRLMKRRPLSTLLIQFFQMTRSEESMITAGIQEKGVKAVVVEEILLEGTLLGGFKVFSWHFNQCVTVWLGGGRRGGGGQGFNFNFGGGGGSPFANMFGGGGGGGRRPRQQQGSPFGNMFGGGGRNRRANQGSSSLDRQAVFLKSNVQRYYKLINVKKPDTSVNAMAIKFKNDPDGLFRKLAGKYKKDPRTILEGDVRKKVQAYYQKIGKSINDPENKKKITQMSKKYALDPNTLFRKLKKKYGK
eukprot:m.159520 g.159520  ORF g.159520 m.159520 type:complete len:268 (-) comp15155_c0_seq2:1614-2417(-)